MESGLSGTERDTLPLIYEFLALAPFQTREEIAIAPSPYWIRNVQTWAEISIKEEGIDQSGTRTTVFGTIRRSGYREREIPIII